MHASTRIHALRAAAKVALSASILGCGGGTTAEPPPTQGPEEAGATAQQVCPGASVDRDASVSAETFACCDSYLSSQRIDGSSFPRFDTTAPASKACCTALIGYLNHDDSGAATAQVSQGVVVQCCRSEIPFPGLPACDAWGPPVPPAMIVLADFKLGRSAA